MDNLIVEHLWRSVKFEQVYLREYADGHEAHRHLAAYFCFYNEERLYQSLGYQTPTAVYFQPVGGFPRNSARSF